MELKKILYISRHRNANKHATPFTDFPCINLINRVCYMQENETFKGGIL